MRRSGIVVLGLLALLLVIATVLRLGSDPRAAPGDELAVQGDAGSRSEDTGTDPVVLEGRGESASAPPSTLRARSRGARSDVAAEADARRALFSEVFRVRVVDWESRGVPQVFLRIRAHGRKGPVVAAPGRDGWTVAAVPTDAHGRAEIQGGNLRGGVVTIEFVRGPDDVLLPAPARFVVPDEEVTIRLERAARVTGRVLLDTDPGRPDTAMVEARWLVGAATRSRRVKTSPDGAFEVGSLPPDATLDLLVYPHYPVPPGVFAGRARPAVTTARLRTPPVGGPAGGAFDVAAGSTGIAIPLDGKPVLDARLLDAQGEPLVTALRVVPAPSSPSPSWTARPDDEGRLVLRAAVPGTYRLDPVPSSLRGVQVDLPFEGGTITFAAVASRTFSGRLLGNGNLAGFRVELRVPGLEKPRIALTDGAGSFTTTVPGGPVSLRATRLGDTRTGALRDVPEGVDEVDVVLDRGLPLRGTIVDVNGAPISFKGWARVEGERVVATSPVLLGGRFMFAALPPGTYTLRVGGDGPSSEVVLEGVKAGATDVTVRLSPHAGSAASR